MIVIVRAQGVVSVKITWQRCSIYMVFQEKLGKNMGRTKVLEKKYMKKRVAKNPIPFNLS
jgi:hypothetical protein